jgi:hypothetical protein
LLRFILAGVQWGQYLADVSNAGVVVTADCISTALAGTSGVTGDT